MCLLVDDFACYSMFGTAYVLYYCKVYRHQRRRQW